MVSISLLNFFSSRFIGLLWQKKIFPSQLSLGYWLGQLVAHLDKWGLLLESLVDKTTIILGGWGKASSPISGDGVYTLYWVKQLDLLCDQVRPLAGLCNHFWLGEITNLSLTRWCHELDFVIGKASY